MGADRGQPEPPPWLPPDDTNPDVRAPDREWYPGTEWYPGQEYQPPRYGDSRYWERRHGETRQPGAPPLPAGEFSSRAQESRELESRELGRRDEYPLAGGHSILGLNPPQRRRSGRRHQVRNGMLIGLGFLIVIVAIGTGLTGEKFPASSRSRAGAGTSAAVGPAGSAAAGARPKSRAAGSGPRPILSYRVTGTPGAQVTYGPGGTYLTGRVPLDVTARLGNPLYYFITVQLAGRGSVQCEILIGTKVMDMSTATGRRNLASCEISRDPLTGKWQDPDGS